ncbi:PAS domain S-box protein [Sulfuricurvum sp.]|uniref:PAS domain S-box protein n=1 Tax=Sulfuricurvum sp. TaxID=2025608 RepID=UPI002E3595D4|nr:PAS domain S-box protein [Sulfuricurvum sp.]HEX5329667.1 PAS domain S-box protein [Sulfuricurvum sp.]
MMPNLLLGISDSSLVIAFLIGCVLLLISLSSVFLYRIRGLQKERITLLQKNELDNKICFLQSRNASIGELTADIAHQWKQPLNAISSIQCALKASIALGYEIPKDELQTSIDSSVELLAHLGETIDTFYRFLSQHKSNNEKFKISEQFEAIQKLTDYAFNNSKIDLRFLHDSSVSIKGDANEFLHALLNIILNAKEALDNISVSFPYIEVLLYETNDAAIITISDNAGGIDEDIIDTIFDRYITSKTNGSGLGLYMAREIIVNRFGGSVAVHNTIHGACFSVILPFDGIDNSVSIQHNTEEKIQRLTERILELEEAKEHLTKWSKIFHNAHWGIAIHIGTSNAFEMTNSAFNALYGYSPDEVENLRFCDLFCEESFPVLSEASSHAFETGHATFEALHRRKDGSIFPVFIEIIVIKNDEGDILYHIANIWDKTDEYKNVDHIRMLGTALDSTNEAVYLISTEAQILYVNDGACRMLGYSREELLSMAIIDLDPNFTIEHFRTKLENLKRNVENHKAANTIMESTHICKNGLSLSIEVSSTLFHIGNDLYVLATVRDITEQKKSAKQIMLITTAINSMSEAVYVNDDSLSIIYVNESACKMLEYTQNELLNMRIDQIDVIHSFEEVFEVTQKLTLNESIIFETKHITKTGQIIDVEIVANLFEFEGKTLGLSIVKDIYERKQSQEELINSEKKYRTLVENSNDNIIRYDRNRRILFMNRTLEKTLSVSMDDIIGKRPTEIWHNAYDEFEGILEQVIATGINRDYNHKFIGKDGTSKLHHIQFIAEYDNENNIVGALIIGRDITSYMNMKDL